LVFNKKTEAWCTREESLFFFLLIAKGGHDSLSIEFFEFGVFLYNF